MGSLVVFKNLFQFIFTTGVFGQMAHGLFVGAQICDAGFLEIMGKGCPKAGEVMKFVIGRENICHTGNTPSVQPIK